MPPVFFYFIGTVTGGFSSGMSADTGTPLVIEAASPGFLQQQIDLRLKQSGFAPEWREGSEANSDEERASPERTLTFPGNLTQKILSAQQVTAHFDTQASSIMRDYEAIKISRGLYTALADTVVGKALWEDEFSATSLVTLNAEPRIWQLDSTPAGNRQTIPSGFTQAIPGTLVMFTLLILLTSGASMLAIERKQGLLRRLASAPLSRSEIVAGKWSGRMILALIQIGIAILVGTLAFQMDWGPDLLMVMVVLFCWAAFCASAGMLLGSIAQSEGQAAGLGVLLANTLAALGGCWWPIEITPGWMQFVQKLLPTGWTMDALHRLISFEAGAASALPHVAVLLSAALIVALLAVNRFRYE
jgi:ABC-type Na+ efflux pump permease subunit